MALTVMPLSCALWEDPFLLRVWSLPSQATPSSAAAARFPRHVVAAGAFILLDRHLTWPESVVASGLSPIAQLAVLATYYCMLGML